ncbi:DUF2092 domain-containing protein [Palleronia sp. KMU-117]|uniref:DUF2092 domain-containing protein n=1 Tax=Palleronia sp. KMU-117 TaxID=3434108 RepID=UPI003D730007
MKTNEKRAGRSVAAAGVLALMAMTSPAAADEADARTLLAAMSDYMTGLETFKFTYDSTLEIVTTEDQKIGLATSGTVAVARPGSIHATRVGGFSSVELGFDGSTFTLIGRNSNVYAQTVLDGTVDSMIDTLREDHGVILPGADLLMANPQAVLLEGVTDVKDLGSGVIGGQECDHIALRNDELDLQVWIAQGDIPHPCRYVLSARDVPHQPQYDIQIRNWTTDVAADDLSVEIPDGATEVELDAMTSLMQALPEIFVIGDAQ